MAETILQRKLSLGANVATGNTRQQTFHTDWYLGRNSRWLDETTFTGFFDYQATDGVDNKLHLYTAVRYARNINKHLFHYYKVEAEHARFQDIDLRLVPTLGLGYWFKEDDTWKVTFEGALGYQQDSLIDQAGSSRVIFTLTNNIAWKDLVVNKFSFYAAADNFDNYRFSNVTTYKAKMNENYSFKLTLKNDFDNQPAAGVLKNDLVFTIGLEYAFKEVKK